MFAHHVTNILADGTVLSVVRRPGPMKQPRGAHLVGSVPLEVAAIIESVALQGVEDPHA
jgi:hypothetical protein